MNDLKSRPTNVTYRYYKIAKDSETGKKFAELLDRVRDFKETRDRFAEKYGIEGFYTQFKYLAGAGEVEFKDKTYANMQNWKRSLDKRAYLPRVNPKDKELKKDWESLQKKSILRSEVDEIAGCKEPDWNCDLYSGTKEYFFIYTEKPELFDFPLDVEGISEMEYLKYEKRN